MKDLEAAPRLLGLLLDLGDLNRAPVCHGYATGCVCADCVDRAENGVRAPARPRQPWELKAA